MKRLLLLVLIIFIIKGSNSQSYLLNFSGSGESSIVDSVLVENLNQGTQLLLNGDDTLHLSGNMGIIIPNIADGNVNIYPNPMQEITQIEFVIQNSSYVDVELFDIGGKPILKTRSYLNRGFYAYEISGLYSGIYVLSIRTSEWQHSSKIIAFNGNSATASIRQTYEGDLSHNKNFITHKNLKSIIQMQYNDGDTLMLTGYSQVFESKVTLVPSASQTVDFNFQGTPVIFTNDSIVNQFQVIPLHCRYIDLNDSVYNGYLGTESIEIFVISDTLLAFMVPEIAHGTQSLHATIEGYPLSAVFDVLQYSPISDPVTYYEGFLNMVYVPSDPNLLNFQDSINYYIQEFNNLSYVDQQYAVAFIEANKSEYDELDNLLADHFTKHGRTDCNGLTLTAHMKCVVLDFIKSIYIMGASSVCIIAVGALHPLAGIVVGAAALQLIFKPYLIRVRDLWVGLATRTFRAVETWLTSSKNQEYVNQTPANIDLHLKIRNIENISYSQNWLNSCIENLFKLQGLMLSTFGSVGQATFAGVIEETAPVDEISFLTLSILNNNNVIGNIGGSLGNLNLTFETTQSTDQVFSYTISYNDGDFSVETNQISAILLVDGPHKIEKVSGDNQNGQVGQVLSSSIVVNVKDANDNPYPGATVSFSANNGGSVSQSQSTTNSIGEASTNWTLGPNDIAQTLTVTAYKNDGVTPLQGSPLTFTASADCVIGINSFTTVNPTTICPPHNGSITVNASFSVGTGALEYSLGGGVFQSSNYFDELGGGSYTVFVQKTDTSCTTSGSTTLTGPNNPLAVSGWCMDSCQFNISWIDLNISGGQPPYQITGNTTSLGCGNHTITVTDDCGNQQTIIVNCTNWFILKNEEDENEDN